MRTLSPSDLLLGILVISVTLVPLGFGAASKSCAAQLFKAKCSRRHGPDGNSIAAIHSPNFTGPK